MQAVRVIEPVPKDTSGTQWGALPAQADVGELRALDTGRRVLCQALKHAVVHYNQATTVSRALFERIFPNLYLRRFLLDQMPKKSVCAEIGVHKGHFSEMILKIVQPRKLHLIDPRKFEAGEEYRRSLYGAFLGRGQASLDDRYNSVIRRFAREIAEGTVSVHRLSSAEAAKHFPDNYFDWVYIDGNHLFPFVKADLETYAAKLKPGGFITGDDYGVAGWWHDGVTKAVDEFVSQCRLPQMLTRNGQFLLKY